nr:hypothetical protein [Corynebacterium freneyi]
MLASCGAAYTSESVGRSKKCDDNCRRFGIEVTRPSGLPRINQELGELWRATGKEAAFQAALENRRSGSWAHRITHKHAVKVNAHEQVTYETLARAGRRVED